MIEAHVRQLCLEGLPTRYQFIANDLVMLLGDGSGLEGVINTTQHPYCYDVLDLAKAAMDAVQKAHLFSYCFLLGCWENAFVQKEVANLFDQKYCTQAAAFCFNEARRFQYRDYVASPSLANRLTYAAILEEESRFLFRRGLIHEALRSRVLYHAFNHEDPDYDFLARVAKEYTGTTLEISEMMDGRIALSTLIGPATSIDVPCRQTETHELLDRFDHRYEPNHVRIGTTISEKEIPIKLSRIQKAFIYYQYWTIGVFDRNRTLIKTHSIGPAEFYALFQRTAPPEQRQKLNGTTALVVARHGWSEYYHWLICVLPAFGRLLNSGYSIDHVLAYGAEARSYCREFFRLLDSDVNVLGELRSYYVETDNLIVTNAESELTREGIDFVKSVFIKEDIVERNRLTYVTRRKASKRRLLNENVVVDLLSAHNFDIVTTEDLPVLEQAKIFQRSKLVLAPHGAGLSNAIFCKEGTTVIEILSAENPTCYMQLCREVSLAYYTVAAEMQEGDLVVDIVDLQRTLETALERLH